MREFNSDFEESWQKLSDAAAKVLYHARLHLVNQEPSVAREEAIDILFWREYRVKSNIS